MMCTYVLSASMMNQPGVGFSAYVTSDQTPNEGETIRFEGVITNEGSHYNPGTSVFTCPTTGLYYFTFSIYAHLDSGQQVGVQLMHAGNAVVNVFCQIDGSRDSRSQCSNSATIQCQAAQLIHVIATVGNSIIINGELKSTFSGFFLHY